MKHELKSVIWILCHYVNVIYFSVFNLIIVIFESCFYYENLFWCLYSYLFQYLGLCEIISETAFKTAFFVFFQVLY